MATYRVALGVLVVVAGLTGVVPPQAGGADMKSPTMHIGVTGSLFRDLPKPLLQGLVRPFQLLVEAQTGFGGELEPDIKAEELGQRLKDNKLQLAVYQGFEFVWAREAHPDLKPLMIAINKHKYLHAYVVVRDDSGAAKLADLKGKTVAVPRRARGHCQLFLERRCEAAGKPLAEFFARVTNPVTAEEALDAVSCADVDAALADGNILDWYKKRKPADYARLKVIETSEAFPATVVAYYAEALDDATLRRFREGMLSAKDNPRSVELMTLCQMTSFEPVPDDYDTVFKKIVKAYPPPKKKSEK